jgi:hypothetical protein
MLYILKYPHTLSKFTPSRIISIRHNIAATDTTHLLLLLHLIELKINIPDNKL